MKNLLISIVGLLLLPVIVFAGELKTVKVTISDKSDNVVVNNNKYELFDISLPQKGDKVILSVEVKNDGDGAIKITNVALPDANSSLKYSVNGLMANEVIKSNESIIFSYIIENNGSSSNEIDIKSLKIDYEATAVVDPISSNNPTNQNTSSDKNNPPTGIFLSILIIFSLISISFIILKFKHKKFYGIDLFLIAISIAFAVNNVTATSAKEFSIKGIIRTGSDTKLIIINPNGGEYKNTQENTYLAIKNGEVFTISEKPIYGNYKFKEWQVDGSAISDNSLTIIKDTEFIAVWDTDSIKICYTNSLDNTICKDIPADQAIIAPSYNETKEGYSFDGWVDSNDSTKVIKSGETISKDSISGEVQLIPHWKANTYTVTFDANGGTLAEDSRLNENHAISYTYGSTYEILPTATYADNIFLGWFYGDTEINATDQIKAANITLVAHWQGKTNTVTFDANGGIFTETNYQINPTKSYLWSGNYDSFPEVTKTGYKFKGWYNGSTIVPAKSAVDKVDSLTLKAGWDPISWSIVYKDGDKVLSTFKCNYGETCNTLPENPEKVGYTFAGWKSVSGTITEVNDGDVFEFVATWNPITYKIIFNNGEGATATSSIDCTYDEDCLLPEAPTKSGFNFAYWSNGDNKYYANKTVKNLVSSVDSTITLTGNWTDKIYSIKIYKNSTFTDENLIKQVNNIEYGAEFSIENPSRTGYNFAGWLDKNGNLITLTSTYTYDEDLIIYPKWEARNDVGVNVTYYYQNINSDEYTADGPYNIEGTSDAYTQYNIPSKTGFVVNKSKSTCDKVIKDTTNNYLYCSYVVNPDGSTAIDIYYDLNSYKVSFSSNIESLTMPDDINVAYNDTIGIISIPSAKGHSLSYWAKGDSCLDIAETDQISDITSVVVTGDANYIACYTPNEYVMTYDYQDYYSGNGTTIALRRYTSRPFTYGQNIDSYPIPTRTGYDFNGWYTEKNGKGTSYVINMSYSVDDNMTLYAYWIPKDITLNIFKSTGTESTTTTAKFDSYLKDNTNIDLTPTKAGYKFSGWYLTSNLDTTGDSAVDTSTYRFTSMDDVSLYAKWIVEQYNITFDANGGTINDSSFITDIISYENNYTLPTPTRTNYTFEGWYDNKEFTGTAYSNFEAYTVKPNNVTLYAKWVKSTQPVITWKVDDTTNASIVSTTANNLSADITFNKGYAISGYNCSNGIEIDYNTNGYDFISNTSTSSYTSSVSISTISITDDTTCTINVTQAYKSQVINENDWTQESCESVDNAYFIDSDSCYYISFKDVKIGSLPETNFSSDTTTNKYMTSYKGGLADFISGTYVIGDDLKYINSDGYLFPVVDTNKTLTVTNDGVTLLNKSNNKFVTTSKIYKTINYGSSSFYPASLENNTQSTSGDSLFMSGPIKIADVNSYTSDLVWTPSNESYYTNGITKSFNVTCDSSYFTSFTIDSTEVRNNSYSDFYYEIDSTISLSNFTEASDNIVCTISLK